MKSSSKGMGILKIFNYLGGALIIFGIGFFISLNWSSLSDFVKIFSTLGAAIACYIVGILLHFDKRFDAAVSAFFMISGLVLPIGLIVTFHVFNPHPLINIEKVNLFIIGMCAAVFLLSHLCLPRTIFLFFSIYYLSLFHFVLIDFISKHTNYVFADLYSYECIVLGISYILLGRYLDLEKKFTSLVGPLYFIGCLFILASSYSLGGTFFWNSPITIWKSITGLLIFVAFFLSVPFKSKSFLYLGALFLIIYLSDISTRLAEIFGDLGWPLILISAGLLLMLVGYLVFNIHKRIQK